MASDGFKLQPHQVVPGIHGEIHLVEPVEARVPPDGEPEITEPFG